MKTLPAIPRVPFANDELPSFNLVLLHDHELAAKAAEGIIARLLRRCLPETDVHQDRWSFTELTHATFRNEALDLANACDLMLVATINRQPLPTEVCSWIEHWTRTRIHKDAALAFLPISFEESLPAGTFPQLSGIDPSGNLAVFTAEFGLAAPGHPATSCEPPRRFLPGSRPERWGINE